MTRDFIIESTPWINLFMYYIPDSGIIRFLTRI